MPVGGNLAEKKSSKPGNENDYRQGRKATFMLLKGRQF